MHTCMSVLYLSNKSRMNHLWNHLCVCARARVSRGTDMTLQV